MANKKAEILTMDGQVVSPITLATNVLLDDGRTAQDLLDSRDESMFSPTITTSSSISKVGQGDNVDFSENIIDGAYKSCVLKGKTLVNHNAEGNNRNEYACMPSLEGSNLTVNGTVESKVKSAILSGQTLVNIAPNMTQSSLTAGTHPWKFSGSGMVVGSASDNKLKISTTIDGSMIVSSEVPNTMKPSTKYYVQVEVKNNSDHNLYFYKVSTQSINLTTGLNKFIITTVGDFNVNHMGIAMGNAGSVKSGTEFEFSNLMIIEYQDGMENWDIPYFTGMQSVKMPVLTTTGKNLFDGELLNGYFNNDISTIVGDDNAVYKSIKIKLTKGTYTLSFDKPICIIREIKDGTYAQKNETHSAYTFTVNTDGYYGVSFRDAVGMVEWTHTQAMIEEGSTTTPYEPYKSNILTVNEDVELRGIGEVKDELDLTTGELTQRIGEIILNGSETWTKGTNNSNDESSLFYTSSQNGKGGAGSVISNNFKSIDGYTIDYGTDGIYLDNSSDINIRISNSKLVSNDVNGFKTWLQSNPTTIQYKIATESIKTVDLSDNHVYSYKDTTHYACSSEEGSLVPTLSIDVPTNLPAVVTRQRVTIQELEKENVALKNEIEETANSSVNGDLELMSSQFELDFRLFEIEMNLDMPMMAMMRGVKSMAMTVYQQAKTLILAGKYEREGMEYKLNRYKEAGRITVEEYEELIALMDARELVD